MARHDVYWQMLSRFYTCVNAHNRDSLALVFAPCGGTSGT